VIASKAARMVLAAPGKTLIDFGLRRAHGAEAGLLAARAAYIAGFAGTATLQAGIEFGIPVHGTMAHSFIQAHDDEATAFDRFARSRPENLTLLIDTYDCERAAQKVVDLAPRLAGSGIRVQAVRIDSGDLGALAHRVRAILDAGGLSSVRISASGGLDEWRLAELAATAPIDGFGVGTSLTVSADQPALDCAYKLQEYRGIARRKWSTGKATWPGRKQIFRSFAQDGRMVGDTLTLEGDPQPGTPLLAAVIRDGKRLRDRPSLASLRERGASELARLPSPWRNLDPATPYPVTIAPALRRLAEDVDRRLGAARP
jgi:nicotinate phosphoribosyltransferase